MRSGWRYLLALVALSALVRWPTLVQYPLNVDEAIYSSISAEMLDGALLYRDVVDHKPPGIYYVYAAIQAVGGRYHPLAVHLALFLVVALTGWLVSRAGALLFVDKDERIGRLAGVLYVVVGAIGNAMDHQAANAELFMNLPSVAAVVVYLRARRSGPDRPPLARLAGFFSAGVLLACGALIKFQAGFHAPALLAHLLLTPGPLALPAAVGMVGFVLPFAAHLAVYAHLGALDDVAWAVRYNVLYVATMGWRTQLERALERTSSFLAFQLVLLVPSFAFLARRRGEPQVDRATWRATWVLLFAWLLCGAAAVTVGGRYFRHYYLQLVPPLALMGAERLLAWTARRRAVAVIAGTVLAISLGASMVVAVLDPWVRPLEGWHQERYRAVGAWVRQHTHERDRIFVWGDSPHIYLQARRPMGARYLWCNYQTGRLWGTPYNYIDGPVDERLIARETWAPLLDDLVRRRPELVIDAAAGGLDEFDRHPIARYPAVAAIVERDYRLEATVLGVPVYRLRR